MKLTEIQEMWALDCRIDETNLGRASANVPVLHSKYLNLLSNARLQLRKAEGNLARIRRLKYRYYRGELTQAELEEQGWNQYQGVKPIKNEMDEFLSTDEDLIQQQDKLEYLRTIYLQLESILKSISSRTWDIKSSIEWYKFSNGM
jgi:hypothetical protein